MLFSVDNDYLFKDYFNLDDRPVNVMSPKDGLILGNMYYDEYDQYKDYKPKEIKTNNERDRMLLKIRELSFAVNDLNLSLDLNPNNKELYALFKKYVKELNDLCEKYSMEYETLELCKDFKNNYSWYKSPWPWEGDYYV